MCAWRYHATSFCFSSSLTTLIFLPSPLPHYYKRIISFSICFYGRPIALYLIESIRLWTCNILLLHAFNEKNLDPKIKSIRNVMEIELSVHLNIRYSNLFLLRTLMKSLLQVFVQDDVHPFIILSVFSLSQHISK